ncbi:MAG: GDP-mannose 4,6-dehydratase [Candidatus Wallbacteria bacterium]|nr:GDP-mannose 4,6-dehydratase [Candidatus Wallbacteria bacterium]
MAKYLVTGGAGFIGSNLTRSLLADGNRVVVLDDLSRDGVRGNLDWLRSSPGAERLETLEGDVRDPAAAARAVEGVDTVFHLAAQVAVTSSVTEPRHDFEVNALGTLNVLEAVRAMPRPAGVVYTSTNKVYGALHDVRLRQGRTRWRFASRRRGVGEDQPLDFHSPYGCSKGAADQYVHDYGRIYGLRTMVFRMSCIYGPRQFGTEDQGWVAHFMLNAARGEPITIYGDGKQVRDLLFIDDLLRAFRLGAAALERGESGLYNIGGGAEHTISLMQLLDALRLMYGDSVQVAYAAPRPGDQPVYITDITLARIRLGWEPQVHVAGGLAKLKDWMEEARRILGR